MKTEINTLQNLSQLHLNGVWGNVICSWNDRRRQSSYITAVHSTKHVVCNCHKTSYNVCLFNMCFLDESRAECLL